MTKILRPELAALIPHGGAMCLLDSVVAWNTTSIHCRSATHQDPSHPLAALGRLSSIHLIEYGAQATAVHGGLQAGADNLFRNASARPGMIVSVRDVRLLVEWIDGISETLEVHATRLLSTAGGQLYEFQVDAGTHRLAQGRLAILFGETSVLEGAVPGDRARTTLPSV